MSSAILVAVSPMSRNNYDPSDKLMVKDGKKQYSFSSPRDSNDPTSSVNRIKGGINWLGTSTSHSKTTVKDVVASEQHSARRPRRSSSLEAARTRQMPVEKSKKPSESSFSSLESSSEEDRKSRGGRKGKSSPLISSKLAAATTWENLKQGLEARRSVVVSTHRPRRSSSLEVPRHLRSPTESNNKQQQGIDLSLPLEGSGRDAKDREKSLMRDVRSSLTRQRSLEDLHNHLGTKTGVHPSPPPRQNSLKELKLELEKLRGARSSLGQRQRVREELKSQPETSRIRGITSSLKPPRYKSAEECLQEFGHESGSSFDSKTGTISSVESDKSQGRQRDRISSPTKQRIWEELKPVAVEKSAETKKPGVSRPSFSPPQEALVIKIPTKTDQEQAFDGCRKRGDDVVKDKTTTFERQDSTGSLTLDDLGLEGLWRRDSNHPSADSSQNGGKAGSLTTSSFLASNLLGGSMQQRSLPMLASVASFGDSYFSMASTASQLSILRDGRFSRSRAHTSRSSLISTLSESQNNVSFASCVTIINETNPGRPTITRRPLPQAGPCIKAPSIKVDSAYGHQWPRTMTARSPLPSPPPPPSQQQQVHQPQPQPHQHHPHQPQPHQHHPHQQHPHQQQQQQQQPKSEKLEVVFGTARPVNRAQQNSLELARPLPQTISQEQLATGEQQLATVKHARQAKANAAFASLGGMLQPR